MLSSTIICSAKATCNFYQTERRIKQLHVYCSGENFILTFAISNGLAKLNQGRTY